MDLSNFCKFEYPYRLSFKSAFNMQKDVDNSFILTHIDILRPWFKILEKIVENCSSLNGILVSDNN
jgi:hypothetical protein